MPMGLRIRAMPRPRARPASQDLIDFDDCCFVHLTHVLPLALSKISKHVSILKDAGLIEGSSDMRRLCYCVN